jgi:hypothetical protein
LRLAQYFEKHLDLYEHLENKNYVARTERVEKWYENPNRSAGPLHLHAIEQHAAIEPRGGWRDGRATRPNAHLIEH